ncbi:hypothetical protein Acsp06_60170 [Actinomycetospora sp. NBRC 106375]|uniref:endonuclease/exonuclease/phosphatase family protein n=1 Tax=Actinomycetospora sp. NBRC 106375 TaxID=3032207 RepID=UPI0024A24EB2|nr:endonuclease/exonuclease/phosphatase family protein [Actinomycetospora sp. NBRC 106375]GLZ49832.1 hypothetical protein Acsp06_60170 [Actinomycetospora sp. NBRC 106375]
MSTGDPVGLRVMTFNIRGFTTPVDGRHRWSLRADHNVATIREQEPDLVGVQELQAESFATYREQLGEYEVVLGPAAGRGRRHEYNAILFDPGRLEVVDAGGFWLSETPETRSASWGTQNVRAANWLTFAVRGTGARFRHVNVHLDHWSGLARDRSAELLVRRLGDEGLPTVVTGDFNCPPGPGPHRTFLARGFEDTYAEQGPDDGTFHGFGGVTFAAARGFHRWRHGPRPLRLDWILVGDGDGGGRWRVEHAAIVRDRDPATGAPPSDHDPVLAELSLT